MTRTDPKPTSPADGDPDAALAALLVENRKRDPEFGGGLSNHLSMALTALAGLGAGEERLVAFAKRYDTRLRPLRDGVPLATRNWRASVGVPAALRGLVSLFESRVAEDGRSALLAEVLPELMPGIGGAAFHGLIRTAYAHSAREDSELCHALAYFVTVAAPLRPLPVTPISRQARAIEILRRAAAEPRFGHAPGSGLISDTMRRASAQDGFDDFVAEFTGRAPDALDDLARATLALYLGTGDFTALHTVTATHALRVLMPYVGSREIALRYHLQAVLAGLLGVARRRLREPSDPSPPSWPSLVSTAIERNDDHDVKFVYTCREEATVRDEAAYREAAALRLGIRTADEPL